MEAELLAHLRGIDISLALIFIVILLALLFKKNEVKDE